MMKTTAEHKIKSINPNLLDVVKRDADYALYYAGQPLTTPSGAEMVHHNPRLLEHMLRELSVSRVLDTQRINACSLFVIQKDFLKQAVDTITASFEEIIKADPVVRSKTETAKTHEFANPDVILKFLDKQHLLAFYFSGITGTLKSLNDFLMEHTHCHLDFIEHSFDQFLDIMKSTFTHLTPEKQAAVISLCLTHESGIVLPLLLILYKITPSEYASALFSIHLPYLNRSNHSINFSNIIKLEIETMTLIPDWKKPDDSFARLREHALTVLEYLSYHDHMESKASNVLELINTGESHTLEFKSCLRWNVKACRKDTAIEHANLKTITAFLNSSGGTLLVGVRDDGSVEGIETDGFSDIDRFSLHFWNLVKSSLGQDVCPFIRTSFEKSDNKTVFIVECAKSPRPVFLNQKQNEEELYIRIGPSSAKLTIREALKYISQRFEK